MQFSLSIVVFNAAFGGFSLAPKPLRACNLLFYSDFVMQLFRNYKKQADETQPFHPPDHMLQKTLPSRMLLRRDGLIFAGRHAGVFLEHLTEIALVGIAACGADVAEQKRRLLR
jgi:hypothetical protein